MSDTPGLSVPLQIPLSKFEKQLAKAEAAAVKRAQNIERKFNEANGRSGQALTKSAAASAQVFERAIQKETRAFQQLKASVDPAYAAQRRYEAAVRQVEAAVRMGAVSQKEANAVLAQAKAAHLGAATAATTAAAQATGFFKVSGAGRFVIQNTSNQIGDMAVQLQMGTDPMRVMAQQLPQVFGGFGALGGVLGTVAPLLGTIAAIGFPVAAFLLASGDNAGDAADKVKDFAEAFDKAEAAINRASTAVNRAVSGDLEALKGIYGQVNSEVKDLIKTLARLEVEKAMVATRAEWNEFLTENTALDQFSDVVKDRLIQVQELEAEISALQSQVDAGIAVTANVAQIEDLKAALAEIMNYEGVSAQFQVDPSAIASISAAKNELEAAMKADKADLLAEAIAKMRAVLATIPDGPLADMGDKLAVAEDMLRRAAAQTQRLKDGSSSINFDAAVASAARMADELSRAVDAMHNLRTQGLTDLETAQIRYKYRNDPVGMAGALAGAKFDRETAALRERDFADPWVREYYQQQRRERIAEAREIARLAEASRPPRKSSGGGRGGGAAEFSLFANSEKQMIALERQIEMIGKSRREIVALTAKYELLDAAKEKGLDLDRRSTETGRTLREEIDLQAEAIANLTLKAEQYAERAEFMKDLNRDLKNGLIDAIIEGKNFAGVLEDVAKKLARAALEAALFGEGPLASLFGGSGGGGGMFSTLLGGLFGASGGSQSAVGNNAHGTNFWRGGPTWVGEQGPEIVNLPRGSKVIPNHKLGRGGGRSQVDVFVHPSGEFDTRVQQISGDVAVNVSGQMISENNRQVSQMRRR